MAENLSSPTPDVVEETLKEIESKFNGDSKRIILVGTAGMGKTWMAREFACRAFGKKLIDGFIWINLNNIYTQTNLNKNYTQKTLLKTIASQLSLLCTGEEVDDDNDHKEDKDEGKTPEEIDEEREKRKKEKVEQKENIKKEISSRLEKGNYLLILDDEGAGKGKGGKMNEEDIMEELKNLFHPMRARFPKVLITRKTKNAEEEVQNAEEEVRLKPLKTSLSLSLLQKRAKMEPLEPSDLFEAISAKTKGLPAAIIVIAEALKCVRNNPNGEWTVRRALERASSDKEAADGDIDLFRCAYDMLPSDEMKKCCWYSRQLFSKHDGMHYNELIAYWIMEGYIGVTHSIDDAFRKGHDVLMDLIDRGLLKEQGDNIVTMEEAALKVIDDRDRGIGSTANLGLANVFEKNEWEGFGRVAVADGMIRSMCGKKKWDKVTTLLIDGHCLCREVPELFFKPMKKLRVLAIFKPRLNLLPSSLFEISTLEVLVLRDCGMLEDVSHIPKLGKLLVLEISGPCSFKEPPFDFIEKMTQLKSLNLSRVKKHGQDEKPPQPTETEPEIEQHSPPTQNQPKIEPHSTSTLRWLILRGCSILILPSLQGFNDIEVIDLSGSILLNTVKDGTFNNILKKIQMIDFSETQIGALPVVNNLQNLSHLFLRNCQKLTRLPGLPRNISVVDVSGSTEVLELSKISSKRKADPKILHFSQTKIAAPPAFVFQHHSDHGSKVSKLILSGCPKLKSLPSTTDLVHLKVLDLSDSRDFSHFEDESFEHLEDLEVLNLSRTGVEKVPSLSKLGNLCKIFLSGCRKLLKLPQIFDLKNLEVLDLSDCSVLEVEDHHSFEHLSCLKELNLSGVCCLKEKEFDLAFLQQVTSLQILKLSATRIGVSSPIPNSSNLNKLLLHDCKNLKELNTLASLTRLEVLDLSGSDVEHLPDLGCSELHQLLLRGCKKITELKPLGSCKKLEVLDLSGTRIETIPEDISKFTCLKRLDLPSLEGIKWEKIKQLSQELNFDHHGTFESMDVRVDSHLRSVSAGKFHFSACSIPEKGKDETVNCFGGKPARSIYSWVRHFGDPVKAEDQAPEVHEYYGFSDGSNSYFKCAKYLSLVEVSSIESLSDLDSNSVKDMKGCWLDRCMKMKSILHGEEKDVSLAENLEILWATNLPLLERLFNENMKLKSFGNIRKLFLDSCPKIENLFSSSQLPESLEVLEIKFCDKLAIVFEPDERLDCQLMNLHTLHLFELPELKRIGVSFPSLKVLKVKFCRKLDRLFGHGESFTWKLDKLETLHLIDLPELKKIGCEVPPSPQDPEKKWKVERCPNLEISV